MRTVFLQQPRPLKSAPAPSYTRAFVKWLGRPLSPREEAIINPLERARARRYPVRMTVVDSLSQRSSVPLLLSYLEFVSECYPCLRNLIIASTRGEARCIAAGRRIFSTAGFGTINNVRGQNFDRILIFTPPGFISPLPALAPVLHPIIEGNRHSVVIVRTIGRTQSHIPRPKAPVKRETVTVAVIQPPPRPDPPPPRRRGAYPAPNHISSRPPPLSSQAVPSIARRHATKPAARVH